MDFNTWEPPDPEQSGYLTWSPSRHPEEAVKTYYRINGERGSKPPILCLHGGPGGFPHPYLLNLTTLADTGHQLILYDQLGCGKSSKLSEEKYRDLWVEETFIEELEHLIDHLKLDQVILFGHSWGTYLAQSLTIRHPRLITTLLLNSAMQNSQETASTIHSRLSELPKWAQDTFEEAERTGKYEGDTYEEAMEEFFKVFGADLDTCPSWVKESIVRCGENRHVYSTMWGSSEFSCTGTLKDNSLIPRLDGITCPVLMIWGSQDIMRGNQHEIAERLRRSSKHVKEVCIEGGRHLVNSDHADEFLAAVRAFLDDLHE